MNSLPTNHRLLVIDDNRAIHEDFRKIFAPGASEPSSIELSEIALLGGSPVPAAGPGFEIDSAFQGEEGWHLVVASLKEGRPYAAAFVDVRMPPGWDGVETVEKIWEIDPDIQIVICTAYSDYSWDEMIAKVGQSDRLVILAANFSDSYAEILRLMRREGLGQSESEQRSSARATPTWSWPTCRCPG